MSRTHKYTWEKRQIDIPDVHSRDYNKKPVVNLKGHQSSGARAPELWCPYNFFGVCSAESEEDGDKRSFSSDLFDESEMSSLLKPKSKRRVP